MQQKTGINLDEENLESIFSVEDQPLNKTLFAIQIATLDLDIETEDFFMIQLQLDLPS